MLNAKSGDQYKESVIRENIEWRRRFLEEKFKGHFKFIPEKYKEMIRAFLYSTPSESFTNPQEEWDKCLAATFQVIEDREKRKD